MTTGYRNLTTVCLAAMLALGLAGCGGSSSTTQDPMGPTAEERAMTQTEVLKTASAAVTTALSGLGGTPTQAAINAASTAVAALKTALDAAADVSDAAKAGYMAQHASASASITAAQAARDTADDAAEKAEMEKMAAAGKALIKAGVLGLGKVGATSATEGTNIATFATDGDLQIPIWDADTSAAVSADSIKKTDASVSSLGVWKGASYERKNASGKVLDTATVYRNQAAAKLVPFTQASSGLEAPTDGVYPLADDTVSEDIVGSGFATAGTKTHTESDRTISGTYKGAPGTYNCPSASCTSRGTDDGVALSADWTFKPSSGAMISEADDDYLFFGWWVNTDADGVPQMASAFRGVFGTAPAALTAPATIGGTATYSGKAAGKFAIYNPLDKSGDAGHFTANASLTAKFSASNAANETGGITGMVDGFMANGKSMPWSVELKRAGWDATTLGMFGPQADPGPSAQTVWSINGNAAGAEGSWSGQMYDENATTDGSNVPTTAVGVFESKYGSTHHMVGGFGATKDE